MKKKQIIFLLDLSQHNTQKNITNIQFTFVIASCKGGVGKSTVASNLAVALNQLGYKIGLLDADIYGPSIPKMFDEKNVQLRTKSIQGKKFILPIEKYGVKMLSIGFFIEQGSALIWRGAMASKALKQLITEVYWGNLDYFIIDLPPGTGDIVLTTIQSIPITGAILVTTPQQVALINIQKSINLFKNRKINIPIIGLIENMSYFTPKELPQNKYFLFGKQGGKELASILNIPFLGEIPIIQSICEAGDRGIPVALDQSQLFVQIAKNIIFQKKRK